MRPLRRLFICSGSNSGFVLRSKRARGLRSVRVVCYHFATQLDSTAQDENERDGYRAVQRQHILGRSNITRTGQHRPNRTPKPGVGGSSPSTPASLNITY